jgi:hypothetical protein
VLTTCTTSTVSSKGPIEWFFLEVMRRSWILNLILIWLEILFESNSKRPSSLSRQRLLHSGPFHILILCLVYSECNKNLGQFLKDHKFTIYTTDILTSFFTLFELRYNICIFSVHTKESRKFLMHLFSTKRYIWLFVYHNDTRHIYELIYLS